jgi:hypothetical protein
MSSPRLVRWRSLKLHLAEAAHAQALAQEALAQRASEALLQQHRDVNQRKGAVDRLDLALLRWLEPIEQATAAAHLWSLAETQARSEERRQAAGDGARARKQLDLTRERARSVEAAHARIGELLELDAQSGQARTMGEHDA